MCIRISCHGSFAGYVKDLNSWIEYLQIYNLIGVGVDLSYTSQKYIISFTFSIVILCLFLFVYIFGAIYCGTFFNLIELLVIFPIIRLHIFDLDLFEVM